MRRALAGRGSVTIELPGASGPSRDRSIRATADRGSVTIELLLMMPGILAMVLTLMLAGRYTLAKQTVDSAAFDAARSASLARTQTAARNDAQAAAKATIRDQGVDCVGTPGAPGPQVVPTLTGFTRAVGQTATVSVRVVCDVRLSDLLALPNFPIRTTITVESTFISPLDTYRGRT